MEAEWLHRAGLALIPASRVQSRGAQKPRKPVGGLASSSALAAVLGCGTVSEG